MTDINFFYSCLPNILEHKDNNILVPIDDVTKKSYILLHSSLLGAIRSQDYTKYNKLYLTIWFGKKEWDGTIISIYDNKLPISMYYKTIELLIMKEHIDLLNGILDINLITRYELPNWSTIPIDWLNKILFDVNGDLYIDELIRIKETKILMKSVFVTECKSRNIISDYRLFMLKNRDEKKTCEIIQKLIDTLLYSIQNIVIGNSDEGLNIIKNIYCRIQQNYKYNEKLIEEIQYISSKLIKNIEELIQYFNADVTNSMGEILLEDIYDNNNDIFSENTGYVYTMNLNMETCTNTVEILFEIEKVAKNAIDVNKMLMVYNKKSSMCNDALKEFMKEYSSNIIKDFNKICLTINNIEKNIHAPFNMCWISNNNFSIMNADNSYHVIQQLLHISKYQIKKMKNYNTLSIKIDYDILPNWCKNDII